MADKIELNLLEVLRDVHGLRDLTFRDGSPMTVGKLAMEIIGSVINMPNQVNTDVLEAWDMIKRLRGLGAIFLSVGELEQLESMIRKANGLIYTNPEMQGQLLSIIRDRKTQLEASIRSEINKVNP